MKIIIIIPTYNEKDNIAKLISAIFALQINNLELIVVDDNSPDGTSDIVSELAQQYPIYLIKRRSKLGIGTAYITGFKKALKLEADYIFEMDADFSHNPQDVPRMLEAIGTADLVIGSRKINHGHIEGWDWKRKLMSNGAMWFSRLFLGLKSKDVTAGFRVFRKKVLMKIDLDSIKSNGYAFQEELLYRTEKYKFKVKEIPVTFVDRQKGESKLSKKDIVEFFLVMFKLRFSKL